MTAINWFTEFWSRHGDRLVFMLLYGAVALLAGVVFDMVDEAKAALLMLSGLLLNKARGNGHDKKDV